MKNHGASNRGDGTEKENILEKDMTIADIEEYVCSIGTDSEIHFGGKYGGYYVQQVPNEIAQVIYFLLNGGFTLENYLEIGTATCGNVRLFADLLPIVFFVSVDDGKHGKFYLRGENVSFLKENRVFEDFVGDSHSEECFGFLSKLNVCFDLVMIDGDHSFVGAQQDAELVLNFVKPGSLVLFHDILLGNVGRALKEIEGWGVVKVKDFFGSGEKKGLGLYEVANLERK